MASVLLVSAIAAASCAQVSAQSSENLLGAPQRNAPSSDRAVRPAVPEDLGKALDADFKALAAARSPREAHGPERRIMASLNRSGSDTVDLFMSWAAEAMITKNYPEALDLIDQALVLKPDFVEAYNRRATIYYALDDYTRSLQDIRTTLALEPRHFGALSGLAAIMRDLGETQRAIEIYHRILDVHPNLENAREELEKLEKDEKGMPL